jgi:hypothetical protein
MVLLFLVLSCEKGYQNNCFDKQGKSVSVVRPLDPFAEVHFLGIFDVLLVQDTAYFLVIETSENYLPYITSEIEGTALIITDKIDCKWSREYNTNTLEVHFKDMGLIRNKYPCKVTTDKKGIITSSFTIYARADVGQIVLAP